MGATYAATLETGCSDWMPPSLECAQSHCQFVGFPSAQQKRRNCEVAKVRTEPCKF
jgi:hypothetical protein